MAGLLPELAFGFEVWLAMHDNLTSMPTCCTIFDGLSHCVTGGIAAVSVQRRDR